MEISVPKFGFDQSQSPFAAPQMKNWRSAINTATIENLSQENLKKHGYIVLFKLTDDIIVCQDPIGNAVLVCSNDNIKKQDQVNKSLVSNDIKERVLRSAIPTTRGIAIIQSNTAIVITGKVNEINEAIFNLQHDTGFSTMIIPVIQFSDIITDIDTVIDNVEIVTAEISNIVQEQSIKQSSRLTDNIESIKDLVAIKEQIEVSSETITSLSTIYHEISAGLYKTKETRDDILKDLAKINDSTFTMLSLEQKLFEINNDMDTIIGKLKSILGESEKIYNELSNM